MRRNIRAGQIGLRLPWIKKKNFCLNHQNLPSIRSVEISTFVFCRKKMVVLNTAGDIKCVEKLDPHQFKQPEGIAFTPDGDLYISDEGKKEKRIFFIFINCIEFHFNYFSLYLIAILMYR